MPWFDFFWSDEPDDNVDHVAEHDLTPDDVEHVVQNPSEKLTSDSSGRPAVKGFTPDGREIFVVYEMIDDITVYVVTAYEI